MPHPINSYVWAHNIDTPQQLAYANDMDRRRLWSGGPYRMGQQITLTYNEMVRFWRMGHEGQHFPPKEKLKIFHTVKSKPLPG